MEAAIWWVFFLFMSLLRIPPSRSVPSRVCVCVWYVIGVGCIFLSLLKLGTSFEQCCFRVSDNFFQPKRLGTKSGRWDGRGLLGGGGV